GGLRLLARLPAEGVDRDLRDRDADVDHRLEADPPVVRHALDAEALEGLRALGLAEGFLVVDLVVAGAVAAPLVGPALHLLADPGVRLLPAAGTVVLEAVCGGVARMAGALVLTFRVDPAVDEVGELVAVAAFRGVARVVGDVRLRARALRAQRDDGAAGGSRPAYARRREARQREQCEALGERDQDLAPRVELAVA